MRLFSNVWSENTALFERLMEIHSNSPKLYYGFKGVGDNSCVVLLSLSPVYLGSISGVLKCIIFLLIELFPLSVGTWDY